MKIRESCGGLARGGMWGAEDKREQEINHSEDGEVREGEQIAASSLSEDRKVQQIEQIAARQDAGEQASSSPSETQARKDPGLRRS